MENVRAVAVDQDARRVVLVVRVAGDVRPLVHHEHGFVGAAGESLREHCAGETCAHDQHVVRGQTATRLDDGLTRRPRAAIEHALDERRHGVGGFFPRHRVEHRVDLAQLVRRRLRERGLARVREVARVAGDADSRQGAVLALDVPDRRGHDGLPAGEILWSLGGADELRARVDREGHERDVPAGEIPRQLGVRFRPQPVQVRRARQILFRELGEWTHHRDLPIGPMGGELREQAQVHPLVDHTEKAEPRRVDERLVRGRLSASARRGEVCSVDAGRKRMHAVVASALGLVETVAAGEDEICGLHQSFLEQRELGRREAEVFQLVHAVVHDARRLEMLGERPEHRRVEPRREHAVPELFQEKLVDHRPQRGLAIGAGHGVGQVRRDDQDAARRALPLGERRGADRRQGLLPKHHTLTYGQP